MHSTYCMVVACDVPVAEGASLHILPAQSHMIALADQRGKGKCLRHGPVDAFASLNHGAPRLIHLFDLRVVM